MFQSFLSLIKQTCARIRRPYWTRGVSEVQQRRNMRKYNAVAHRSWHIDTLCESRVTNEHVWRIMLCICANCIIFKIKRKIWWNHFRFVEILCEMILIYLKKYTKSIVLLYSRNEYLCYIFIKFVIIVISC